MNHISAYQRNIAKMHGYHETYSIQPDQGTENLCSAFCAFKGKRSSTTSSGWDVHEGKLIQKHSTERKIYAKVRRGLLKEECQANIDALKFAQKVIRQLKEVPSSQKAIGTTSADVGPMTFSGLGGVDVQVVPTFYAEVETLSRIDKLTAGKNNLNVTKGGFVMIQDRVQRDVGELWAFDSKAAKRSDRTNVLNKLAMESFRLSKQERAIASIEGTVVEDSENNTNAIGRAGKGVKRSKRVTYYITSVTVHSKNKTFGPTDRGAEGLAAFHRHAQSFCDSESLINDKNNNSKTTTTDNYNKNIDNTDSCKCDDYSLSCERLQPTAPPLENEDSPASDDRKVEQMNQHNVQNQHMLEKLFRGGPIPMSRDAKRYIFSRDGGGIE